MPEASTVAIVLLAGMGGVTGVLSGMLGIGGGLIVVPALIVGLPVLGIDGETVPKIAMATSLATVIPTALASAQGHAARGSIDWYFLVLFLPSCIAGAVVTATYMRGIDARLILLVFIVFMLYSAYRLLWKRRTPPQQYGRPQLTVLTTTGVVGGALSALLGIGVAMVVVPYLERFIALPRAIGTAAALALPMALAGTVAYVVASPACPSCLGYVYLPAVASIGIAGVLTVPVGVWLSHRLPIHALKRAFAAFLIIAAGSLAYKTFTIEMVAAETARFVTLAQHALVPSAIEVQPAEVPAWIGREPLQTSNNNEYAYGK